MRLFSFHLNLGKNERKPQSRLLWKPTWLFEKIFQKQRPSPSHHHLSKDWEHQQASPCNCKIDPVILRSTSINRLKILLQRLASALKLETSFRFIDPMCHRKK